MILSMDFSGIEKYISKAELDSQIQKKAFEIQQVFDGTFAPANQLGWFTPSRWQGSELVSTIKEIASEIREQADVFVLIGVGGSNRGAQSVIESLGDHKVEVIYAGNNLSAKYLNEVMDAFAGKSVYINAIAKDFNTLEPGIHFRFLRNYLEKMYGEDAARRIIVTGSEGKGQLFEVSGKYGYRYLPFPDDMSGRFSVISAVGLLPMAVAGIDIEKMIDGAISCEQKIKQTPFMENDAVKYAAARNLLFDQGFVVENMVTLEPHMFYFARWWAQLFAESEGKNQQCIFPTMSNYSEDLHAVGQYIQDGKRMVMETFLNARFPKVDLDIPQSTIQDGFDYLNGKSFEELNSAVFEASYFAHKNDDVPCFRINCGEINESMFGELFYFFLISCCVSALIIDVDPFGQGGVEAYKNRMYQLLGK